MREIDTEHVNESRGYLTRVKFKQLWLQNRTKATGDERFDSPEIPGVRPLHVEVKEVSFQMNACAIDFESMSLTQT